MNLFFKYQITWKVRKVFETCSMVFQSPHGRLYYSFMLLDRDVAYFNFILSTIDWVYTMLPHNTMIAKPCFISGFKSKAHAWYEFKIKSV